MLRVIGGLRTESVMLRGFWPLILGIEVLHGFLEKN
jgi:hypothetical protein